MTAVGDRTESIGFAAEVLDEAVWASLTGPHAHLAEGAGPVRRYPADVSPFAAVAPDAGESLWPHLHTLVGDGAEVALTGTKPALLERLPAGWQVLAGGEGVQLVATDRLHSTPDDEAVRLGTDDVAEMLDLVMRTQPGPFLPRTVELGTYLGIRRAGRLVAMAGERLHPPGWTEISAVCTDPAWRGLGLASRLVRAVAHGIRGRGETPMMHAAATNTDAIRLYLELGFTLRRRVQFTFLLSPSGS